MTKRYISTGMASLISNRDPHRRKLSLCAARRRRLEPLFLTTVTPRFLQVAADFTLETPSYRLNDFEFDYTSPDGLLHIFNNAELTGALIMDPDNLNDPAIPVSVVEVQGGLYLTIHADGVQTNETFLG